MGFVIWYQIQFPKAGLGGFLPLRISNDVFSGEHLLDADITLTMPAGAVSSELRVVLSNLPTDVAKKLKTLQTEGLQEGGDLLEVEVYIGYFDDVPMFTATDPVMKGYVTKVKSTVADDGTLKTEIVGEEQTGYRLRKLKKHGTVKGQSTVSALVQKIAQEAGAKPGDGPPVTRSVEDFTFRADTGFDALRQLAALSDPPSPIVIRDGKVYFGPQVGTAADRAPAKLSPETNIVRLDESQDEEATGEIDDDGVRKAKPRTSLTLTTLGIPGLRVGQQAKLDVPEPPGGTLRVNHVVHRFSTRAGYTCEIVLAVADPGAPVRTASGARAVVDRFRSIAESARDEKASIDVGQVAEYEPGSDQKHLATLDYGQPASSGIDSPSVAQPIEGDPKLHRKPIVSPFAWHQTGLVVPVYKGMRAVLGHHRDSANDALVMGFVWSEDPRYEPPKNEAGDYWLCLPTQVVNDKPSGKGVNDLTDKSGLRVIEAKGFRIAVGEGILPSVGTRPKVPNDLANSIVIEHSSGTKVAIDSSGKVELTTKGKDVSIGTGGVTLKVGSSGVEIS
jgi:hypothetical protein